MSNQKGESMQQEVVSLPAKGVVRLSGGGKAVCVVEKATRKSYWVRWSESMPGTRIQKGMVDLVPRGAVELIAETPEVVS